MKIVDLVEQEDEFAKQTYEVTGTTEQQMEALKKQMNALAVHYARVRPPLTEYVNSGLMLRSWQTGYKAIHMSTPYKGRYAKITRLDWATATDGAKTEDFVIDPSAPNIGKLWPKIEDLSQRTVKYASLYVKLLRQYNKLKKAEREEFKASAEGEATATPVSSKEDVKTLRDAMTSGTAPANIHIGKRSISNPLFYCEGSFYVGPPEKYFDLSGPMWDLFVQMQKGLKAAGVPPMTILYGGRKKHFINFAMINGDGTVVWRKYQSSAQSSDNTVYLSNNDKVKASFFAKNPAKYLGKKP